MKKHLLQHHWITGLILCDLPSSLTGVIIAPGQADEDVQTLSERCTTCDGVNSPQDTHVDSQLLDEVICVGLQVIATDRSVRPRFRARSLIR